MAPGAATMKIMMRGTFANIRLANEMVPEKTGGYTRVGDKMILSPSLRPLWSMPNKKIPLVIIAGKEYGTGSSRDWAAKGTKLLGIKAVIAESFERIHRSNLVGMGILPLMFPEGLTVKTLALSGLKRFAFWGLKMVFRPGMTVSCEICRPNGRN